MTDRKTERRGLGRGLSALMADVGLGPDMGAPGQPIASRRDVLSVVPTETVYPNPDQPRRRFDERALLELAESIKEKGVVQPLIVRTLAADRSGFEIVAGERRWRAAQMAGLAEIPVIVRQFDDREVLEIAIIENIQREGLNAIEEASSYRQLIDRFGHTQEKVAEALGKSRSHIANLLRLLTLPQEVQSMVIVGTLTPGHARALITAEDPVSLAAKVVGKGLSVRETEDLARAVSAAKGKPDRSLRRKDADTLALEQDLTASLGLAVAIEHSPDGRGTVRIRYATLDQLDQLCQLFASVRH